MRGLAFVAVWWLLASVAAAQSAPAFDVLLAQVEVQTVAASDVALVRALHLFGFGSPTGPIERGDVERFVDVLLLLEEASRIGLAVQEPDLERAWAATVARVGSETRLERWLTEHAIDRAWARRVVEADVLRAQFFEARFAAFVFVGEEEISRELGPGSHDDAVRERARQQIARVAAEKAQVEWLVAARRRATIHILISPGRSVEPPFPPP